jgi:hypothetical protein
MKGGMTEEFPIRMVQCKHCGERFSLLPSFLPREKHFCIDIIGEIMRPVFLFGSSIRAAFEMSSLTGRKLKSIQTILNWINGLDLSIRPSCSLAPALLEAAIFRKMKDSKRNQIFVHIPWPWWTQEICLSGTLIMLIMWMKKLCTNHSKNFLNE